MKKLEEMYFAVFFGRTRFSVFVILEDKSHPVICSGSVSAERKVFFLFFSFFFIGHFLSSLRDEGGSSIFPSYEINMSYMAGDGVASYACSWLWYSLIVYFFPISS